MLQTYLIFRFFKEVVVDVIVW